VEHDDELRTPGGLVVPATALTWSFARSGGAGGQHVNTTSSKATLAVAVAEVRGPGAALERLTAALGPEVRVTSQTSRSQWRNRQECRERAAEILDRAARPPEPPRRPSRPTRGSVERRLEAKRRDSEKKQGRRPAGW
jgi:ribosome-associated protein